MTDGLSKSLFLCRTPLQARICIEILNQYDELNFDLIYFTQNDSDSDRYYYSRLSAKASGSCYLYTKKKKKDIFNHIISMLKLRRKFKFTGYERIFLASIDSFVFRYVISKNKNAVLVGFDDGTANITPGSQYYNLDEYKRASMYSAILCLPKAENIKSRLSIHYSIYPGFSNIVPSDRLLFVNAFNGLVKPILNDGSGFITYFIGQPFHEYLEPNKVKALKSWVESKNIDFYVMHPREEKPLIDNVEILDKKGLLAEDAIFQNAGGARVRIISAYSTVLFNISSNDAEKIYLSLSNDEKELERCSLIRKTGAKIVNVYQK